MDQWMNKHLKFSTLKVKRAKYLKKPTRCFGGKARIDINLMQESKLFN